MKKISLIFIAFSLIFVSCDKEKNEGNPEVFSQKTVEQNKEIVEQAGLDMMNTMDDMAELDAIEVCVNLGESLDMADPFESTNLKKSKFNSTIHAIADLGKESGLNKLFNNLKYAGELEDPETIQEVWDEIIGTYTWNAEMEEWDYEANSNDVIFLFPATENSTSNDGKVRIFGYQGVTIANPIDEEYDGDIPTALAFEISLNDNVLISFTFTAQYDSEGIPTMVAADLDIPPFKWEVDFTSTDTKISASYKFTHNQLTVMELSGSSTGVFTDENIENNTITEKHYYTYYDYIYNEETGMYEYVEYTDSTDYWTSEEFMFEEVANSAEARFQMFNVLLKGQVDIKKLADEIRIIDDRYSWEQTDEERLQDDKDGAKAINDYMSLRVLNAQANEIIAEIEAYVVTEDNTWDNGFDSWIDFRFKFGDGSTIDAETYFDDGFETFVDEINRFIDDLNDDYDLDIENVDYK